MWMSGEVTSMPSFTRSGRPSFSFASSPPSGRTSTAFRVRSASVIAGYTSERSGAASEERNRPPKRRRIRKLRLLALLVVLALLGFSAFTFGLLTAIAAQMPELDPARQQQHQQKNTYVYASDGQHDPRHPARLAGADRRRLRTRSRRG